MGAAILDRKSWGPPSWTGSDVKCAIVAPILLTFLKIKKFIVKSSADPEGGDRESGPLPPGKSQVIWFCIGNKQLDPPGKSWTPPHPWKMLDPPLEA